jgi:hypothetical protein
MEKRLHEDVPPSLSSLEKGPKKVFKESASPEVTGVSSSINR